MAIATAISLGLSWPRILSQLFEVASHLRKDPWNIPQISQSPNMKGFRIPFVNIMWFSRSRVFTQGYVGILVGGFNPHLKNIRQIGSPRLFTTFHRFPPVHSAARTSVASRPRLGYAPKNPEAQGRSEKRQGERESPRASSTGWWKTSSDHLLRYGVFFSRKPRCTFFCCGFLKVRSLGYSSTSSANFDPNKTPHPLGTIWNPQVQVQVYIIDIRGKEDDKYGCYMIVLCYQKLMRDVMNYHNIYHLHHLSICFLDALVLVPNKKKRWHLLKHTHPACVRTVPYPTQPLIYPRPNFPEAEGTRAFDFNRWTILRIYQAPRVHDSTFFVGKQKHPVE